MLLQMGERSAPADRLSVLIVHHASWAEIHKAHPENVMAPLTLGYAMAILEAHGHRVTLVDTETGAYTEGDLQQITRSLAPDVVVLDGITTAVPSILRTARFVRQQLPRTLLIASGEHATAKPGDYLHPGSPFDACTTEEYEETIAELVDAWSADRSGARLGDVPGVILPGGEGRLVRTSPRPLRDDLDALPFPSHEQFQRKEYVVFHPVDVRGPRRWGFIMSSRGCPYPCLYCSPTLRNSYGRKMRFRSARSVVDEMEHLVGLGTTAIVFKDDIFTVNRERTLELCEEIRRRGVRVAWNCQTRADCVDREVLTAMRAAGCSTVCMGIESGSPRILDVLRKRETVEDSIRAGELIREAGLHMVNFFLLGNPTETQEDMQKTFDLALKLDPDILQVGFFTPYPGSPYYEETYRQIDRRSPEEFSHYNRIINLSAVPTDQLLAFQKKFYLAFALRPRFVARFAGQLLRGLPGNLEHDLRFFALGGRFLLSSARARLPGATPRSAVAA
jgi:radical SAM superfamily enzyme YgiQ (UPF0313 family)